MEQTIQALLGILLKAVPTVGLLIFLLFYFKAVLFGPLDKILKQRGVLTEGARKAADESLASADRKATEYETKLRDARAVVYKEQEETRKRWLDDQASQVAEARARSEASVKAEKAAIASEAAAARQTLSQTSATLADRIVATVLSRKAQAQ
jgi:F-type H+-transporting ATPase subunit b